MQDNKKIITVKCLYCFYVNAIWAVRLQCVHILHWIIKLPACLFNLFTSLLIYSLKTGPFLFKARGHKRQPNLALVFLCSFGVVVYFVADARLLLLCFIQFLVLSQHTGWWKRL